MTASHLSALKKRRDELKQKLRDELKHPARNESLIRRLKEQNLHLKDKIATVSDG